MTKVPNPTVQAVGLANGPRRTTGRSILAALCWLLACLAILVSGITLWAHQTVLTSAGWGGVVAGVIADPEVVDATSERVVARVSDALGVQDRVAQLLPGDMSRLAGVITGAVEQRVADGVAQVASTEQFQDIFVTANEKAHEAAMKVIRGGDNPAISSEEGTISLDVFPMIGAALTGLQEAGVIPESVTIPDMTDYQPNADRVAAIEQVIGRDLPEDLGTITLVQSDGLATVQSAVRAFDVITIAAIVLALVFIALALVLSARRLRMIVWLALGGAVALLGGRFVTRVIAEDVTGALRSGDDLVAVRSTVDSTVDSMLWFTFALIVVALAVAVIALLVEHRAEVSAVVAEPASFRDWLRSRSRVIAYVGIGLVAFFVLWTVGGPDISMAAAAIVGILLLLLAVVGGRGSDDDAEVLTKPSGA